MEIDSGRKFLEESIIGACLIEKPAYDMIKGILSPKDFQSPRDLIYTAFVRLSQSNGPIDLVTTYDLLRRKKQPVQADYLASCTMVVNSADNLQHHALILLQINLEETITNLLQKHISKVHVSIADSEIDKHLALNCLEKVVEKEDPLVLLDLITSYLMKRAPEGQLTKEMNNVYQKFYDRCQRIKREVA